MLNQVGQKVNILMGTMLFLNNVFRAADLIKPFSEPVFYPQFSSVAQSCPTLCNPVDCSTPGLPVHHQLLKFTQTHAHWVSDAIQPSHPLSSPSPPAFNLSQHQGLFKWVSSSHQVAKIHLSFLLKQTQSIPLIYKAFEKAQNFSDDLNVLVKKKNPPLRSIM